MNYAIYSNFGEFNDTVEKRVLEEINSGRKVTYILPTKNAAIQYRNYYVNKLGGISDLDFVGLDSLRKISTSKKVLDRSLKKYFVKNILKNGKFESLYFSGGMVSAISTLIALGRESLVDSTLFENASENFLKEVGEVYKKYEDFISNSKYTDLTDIESFKSETGLVVFDGFYSMKKADIKFIEKIANSHEVIFNIPYLLIDINYTEKLVDRLKKIGFEIRRDEPKKRVLDVIEELKSEERLKFANVKSDRENEVLFKFLKRDLLAGKRADVITLSDVKNIRQLENIENLKLNYISTKVNEIKIVEEFKILIDYILEQNRGNLIRRLNLNYFKINSSDEKLISEISKIEFKDLNSLINNTQTEISAEIDLTQFLATLEELKIDIKSRDTFENYSDIFLSFLENTKESIENFYGMLNDIEVYKNDLNTLNSIVLVLNNLKEYGEHFGMVSVKEYTELLIEYLDRISFENRDPFKSKVFSLDGSLKYNFENLYITSFNENFPNYRSGNFMIETQFEFLKQIGFEVENEDEIYQRELLKFLIAISSSENTVIFKDEENLSAYSFMLNLDKVVEDRISTMSELFSNVILESKKEISENYLDMYQSKRDIEDIIMRIFEERLRNLQDNKVTLSGNAKDILKSKIEKRGLKVSDLDSWVRSPYSFLYLELVGLKDILKEPEKINMQMGTDFHKILERYFRKYDTLDQKKLEEIVEPITNNSDFPQLRKKIYCAILSEYIKVDLENRDGFRPKEFEMPFIIKIGNIDLSGRIDRVDQSVDGKIIVTDYKLSSAPGFEKQGTEVFQIPIYMSFFEGACVEGKYGFIKGAKVSHVIRNIDEIGKIKGARNQLSTEEFKDKLQESLDNALKVIYLMYNGIFDKWDDVDSRISDLARS
ncbi:PD-(D/E)XK nuclease family protein [Peptoniphilus indolicus]|nr:PD-(D/E)XK nuclease family protein [Peptoniphilus indolicus]SUB74476.1 Inactivated superfamily I helicase [Peptoniphilus indolicus]